MAEAVSMAGGGASSVGGGNSGGMIAATGRPPSIHRDGDLIIAEESEKSSGGGSPSPTRGSPLVPRSSSTSPPLTQQTLHQQSHLGSNSTTCNQTQQQQQQQQQNATPSNQQHCPPQSQSPGLASPLGMLRGLQGLSGLPQISQQMSQLAANLQGLASQASLPNQPPAGLSSPLNLSVGGSGLNSSNNSTNSSTGGLLQPALPSPMPQLILASGQLVQGIQGAQLLIPTSQGIATQTILTIPVNQVSSNDQMVNLALNNGQVVSTSLANLQAMAQPHQLLNNQQSNTSSAMRNNLLNQSANAALTNALLNPAALSNLLANGGAQQLLQAMQQQQQPQNHLLSGHVPSHNLLQNNPSNQGNQHSPSSNNWNDQTSQHMNQQRHYKDRDTPYHHQNNHGDSSFLNDLTRDKNSSRDRDRDRDRESLTNGMNGSCSNQSAVAAAAALSSISRLAASNGELTITAARSTGSPGVGGRTPPCKSSPASTEPEDLLADSPDQPTINQTSSNMVDGINLDDIKEFAKAFKLRRLSLGLTQTQVGQALSVTEGPAYSQSAICSALASQMFAAQLSSQQPNIFEKLDITPKSAQKIKPVLERWMKEAEERYASGQSHLTDFIGMEPSKKRKRRTSFTPQALELLNAHFERNTHPSGTEITGLAHQLGYEREVIRIWFCNKRQALKNTVRMMSKGMV